MKALFLGFLGIIAGFGMGLTAFAFEDGGRPPGAIKVDEILKNADVFHGIEGKKSDRFWEKWRLVTVRFRKDNGELRFIYANPIAWKALASKKFPYPDGAMFGKVAFASKSDPVFPVSETPEKVTRIQLMRKDSKKYRGDTGNWGYAIYPPTARGGNEEKHVVVACHACHQAIPSKDYVFSDAVFAQEVSGKVSDLGAFQSRFRETSYMALSAFSKKVLDQTIQSKPERMKFLEMPVFSGALHESIGPLSSFSNTEKVPFLLMEEESQQYLLVSPASGPKDCKDAVDIYLKIRIKKDQSTTGQLMKGLSCAGVNKWEYLKLIPEAR